MINVPPGLRRAHQRERAGAVGDSLHDYHWVAMTTATASATIGRAASVATPRAARRLDGEPEPHEAVRDRRAATAASVVGAPPAAAVVRRAKGRRRRWRRQSAASISRRAGWPRRAGRWWRGRRRRWRRRRDQPALHHGVLRQGRQRPEQRELRQLQRQPAIAVLRSAHERAAAASPHRRVFLPFLTPNPGARTPIPIGTVD